MKSLSLAMIFLSSAVFAQEKVERLPYPRALFHKVEFWKTIYTKYTTREGILHDSEDLSIIYGPVQLTSNGGMGPVDQKRNEVREAIFNILNKRGQNLTLYERDVLSKFPKYASRSRLIQAAENIRFQLGQTDRFREGVVRSGRYLKYIESIIREEGGPDFLKYLPHVESSFNRKAISKFGAAGLWQLMPDTGRRYIRVDYLIDERLDPYYASRAAVRYLLSDFKRLGEWPLAVTAYNHGAGGVQKAVNSLGTTDIAEIAFQYSTPSFGFASRNFYAQFLAAVQVAQDYEKYFGNIALDQPLDFETIELKDATYYKDFSKRFKMTDQEFQDLNPSIRPPLLQNYRPIPKGLKIRVPKGSKRERPLVAALDKKAIHDALSLEKKREKEKEIALAPKLEPKMEKPKGPTAEELAAILGPEPETPKVEEIVIEPRFAVKDYVAQKAWIKVEINETISQIAEWMNVSADNIRKWNGFDRRGQVRLGQRLILRFDNGDPKKFEIARSEYHRKIREDFFSQYRVTSFVDYQVQAGENLWSVCFQKFEMPPWLLAQFNPDANLAELKPGDKLRIPVIAEGPAEDSTSAALTNGE